jgi:hypothetical protein
MASSSPRIPSQVPERTASPSAPLDHTQSLASPLDIQQASLPKSHTSKVSLPKELNDVATASMRPTDSTRAGLSFLSLPPEIRNMIYHYILTPVKDGTCQQINIHWHEARLKGVRSSCFVCPTNLPHATCHSGSASVRGMYLAFDIIDRPRHSGIMQTCKTTLKEALPISLACLHISLFCPHDYVERALVSLLANMRQPRGAFLSTFTCRYYETSTDDGGERCFSQLINGTGIRIGRLILCEITESAYLDIGKLFIATLDRLDHKPASVEWTPLSDTAPTSYQYESQRCEFNEATGRWLANLATVKAAGPTARLPLLRDFLPQYLEESPA